MDIHSKLVNDLKNGSYDGFNKLYEIYADSLYNFALGITKSPSEARDILQETFLKLWYHRENISLEYSFKAYLYKIAKNLILNSYRKQINSIELEKYICSEEYQMNVENNAENDILFDEFVHILKLAKQDLTERQKEIFEMNREENMSITEIATKLNLSKQTVKNQLTISMKSLRAKLARYSSLFT